MTNNLKISPLPVHDDGPNSRPSSPPLDPLLESIQLLTRWLDREDDLPTWIPLGLAIGQEGSLPYRTEAELALIRQESRWLAASHPFALSAMENRISYVVGSGHQYKVRPRPAAQIDQTTIEKIEAELLDFQERHEWGLRQQEIQRRMDRDGEVFLRLFDADGRLTVRLIEPEQVRQPLGRQEALFGIEVDPLDAETVRAYWVQVDPRQLDSFQRIPAEQVQHRKANVDRTAPRGLPLLWSMRHNLRRAWKLLRNMSTVASIQAAIAIVRRHTGATAGSIQQYVTRLATLQQTDSATGQTKTYQQFPPGAIVDTPPGVEYTFPASGIDVAKYVEALQAELRAIAARLAMPEFMLSADASNANYASTMVAEGPAVKMFERLQAEMIWYDIQIMRRALEVAERAGRLPDGVSRLVEIDAEAPIVLSRDRLKEAQADQILLALGVISPQTVAARHGYNYEQERSLMDQAAE